MPRVLVTTSNRGKSPLLIFTLNSCALDAKDGCTAQESIACNSVDYLYIGDLGASCDVGTCGRLQNKELTVS